MLKPVEFPPRHARRLLLRVTLVRKSKRKN
jgi:hypothetical protein